MTPAWRLLAVEKEARGRRLLGHSVLVHLESLGIDPGAECRFARRAALDVAVDHSRSDALTGTIGAAGMNGLDDLGVVDALKLEGGDAEVAVAELTLDDDQRHAFASHLDRVGVSELVRSETPAHTRCGGSPAKVGAGRSVGPLQAACRAVGNTEERPDRQLESDLEPWLELVPAPRVHSDLASASALAAPDQECAAAEIDVGFGECERLLNAQPGAPKDHNQSAQPAPVRGGRRPRA